MDGRLQACTETAGPRQAGLHVRVRVYEREGVFTYRWAAEVKKHALRQQAQDKQACTCVRVCTNEKVCLRIVGQLRLKNMRCNSRPKTSRHARACMCVCVCIYEGTEPHDVMHIAKC